MNAGTSGEGRRSTSNEETVNTEDALIIKGDAVGNTVYSSRWIINTLISLAKFKENDWTEEFEKELCALWDMTAEKDVVNFIVLHHFIPIADYILDISKEPRLTEIILGILGNACSYTTVVEMVGRNKNLTTKILNLLSSDDAESLIQIVRLLQLVIWHIKTESNSIWLNTIKECTFFGEALLYILNNSTNNDLLVSTTDLFYTISNARLPNNTYLLKELFETEKLLPALLESFLQMIPDRKCYFIEKDLMLIENWLAILTSMKEMKCINIDDTDDQCSSKIPIVLYRILQPYQRSYNLIPVEERTALCIHETIEIMLWFERSGMYVGPQFNCILASMLHTLKSDDVQNNVESFPDCVLDDLVEYLQRYWLRIFDVLTTEQILEIIESCEKETVNTLMQIFQTNPKMSSAKRKKLMEIQEHLVRV